MIGSVARRGRWHEFLSQFNLEIVYVPGKDHKVSDALSRWAYPASIDTQEKTFHGDSKGQKHAELMDKLENDEDFASFRVSVICEKGVFREKWKYTTGKWKTLHADLKANRQRVGCHLDQGRVYQDGKLCVPRERTNAVIQFYHSSGHPSGYKLLDIVLHRCEFEQSHGEIQKICRDVAAGCHVCQAVKPCMQNYGTLDYCPVPQQVFSSLCIDFLSLAECTDEDGNKYDYVMVVVDRLSGYICGIPCLKMGLTAEKTARLFIRHCVHFMGVPLEILSDCDHRITGKFFQTLCHDLGIEQHTAIIYRPKGNGRAERAVRSVIGILRLTLTGMPNQKSWADVLSWSCFLQNSLPGVIAGYSPHKIVFGRDLILPGELPGEKTEDAPVSAKKWLKELDDQRRKVRERMLKVHERERSRYLKEHATIQYVPGDKVWLRVESRDRTKLDPLWMGPCEVLRHVRSGRYTIQTPYGAEDHHIDHMKPYRPDLSGKSIPFMYYQPNTVPEGDTWIVEKILRHRKIGDRLEWLVKWRGYTKPTWETAEQFVGYTQDDWKEYNLKNRIAITFE